MRTQVLLVPVLVIQPFLLRATAQSTDAVTSVEILPESCEVELALSAAPEHLRDRATVFAFRTEGYMKVRRGTNGFSCLVNRDHPRVLKPTCFDSEGSKTIVPKILRFGELLAQDVPVAEIQLEIDRGFEDGTFARPGRPGIAYMFSHYNRPYNRATDRLGWFPPHLMFFAPDLSNEDIGVTREALQQDSRLPFVAYQGPHGFMIVVVEAQSRPQEHPISQCPSWVSADPPNE